MVQGVRQPAQPQPTATAKPSETPTPAATPKPTPTPTPASTAPAPTPTPTPSSGGGSTFDPKPSPTPTPSPAQTTPAPVPTPAAPAPWSFSSSINADRAKSTRAALEKLVATDETAKARLTGPVIDALVNGVSTPRTQSQLGQEGVLGRRQALEAAKALIALPQPAYDQVMSLLGMAGQKDGAVPAGANPDTERALILKAVAARAPQLGQPAAQEQALGELGWFAGEIRGLTRDNVVAQTSVIDVNDQANTSQANPLDATVSNDQRADNDGYAQRFTSSCAPAVAAMARAEADPVFALMLSRDGLQNADPTAGASQLEKQILERDRFFNNQSPEVQLTPEQLATFQQTGKLPPGVEHLRGAAVSRVGEQARKVMDETLDDAVAAGKLTKGQAAALRKDVQGGTLTEAETTDRDAALKVVRDASGNRPSDFEMQAMRGDRPREDFMLMAHAMRDLVHGVTNNEYWNFNAGNALNTGHMDNMARLLSGGHDLPARLSTPGQDGGHFILFTDVRTQGGQREFLASDPWSGRTAWLKESELTNPKSDWPRREFDVFWQQVTDLFAPLDFVRPEEQ